MRFALFVLALSALAPARGAAAPADSSRAAPPRDIHAVRATSPVTIDGSLNEAVWQSAEPVDWFVQRDPHEGAAPSQRTEVRVAYDDDALYVGARCFDTKPDSIVSRLVRRDASISADHFVVFLDPYYDRRTGFYFKIFSSGTLADGTLYNDEWDDNSWDGVWEGRTKVDDQGWVAEMRIPYSQLRFQKKDQYVWGVNFRRNITRTSEQDYIVYTPRKESGFVSRFPKLVGIESVQPGRAVELMPYVTTKAEYLRHESFDPFNDGSRYKPNGGADLRVGVGSKLTLNATVNPDFGQVEVDPAVVNLSDVETFYPEKRPFFVENSSVFGFGQQGANNYWGFNWPEPTFFYSRRIGRAPQGSAPSSDFVDYPSGTTILGAGKLTGKVTPSFNFGTLHAVTSREEAKLWSSGVESDAEVEPMTYYGVLRGTKEFNDRRQGLGSMTTITTRRFKADVLQEQFNTSGLMTGLDGWTFLDKNKVWVISGWSGLTHVTGDRARIESLQRGSTHYLQRPDRENWHLDPDATSLTGFGARMWLNKQKGNIFSNNAIGFMTPTFDVNDMGFMSRADVINGHVGTGRKWPDTNKWKKYAEIVAAGFDSHDFDGNHIWGGGYLSGNIEFINNYSWSAWSAYNPQTVNNRRTRGGPLSLNKPGFELGSYFDTDGKSKFFWYVESGTYSQPEIDTHDYYVAPGIEWKPVSNFVLNVGPQYSRSLQDVMYVTTVDDPGNVPANFGDKRYVFARLDQKTIQANIRLNVSFTPNLSLQTFLQPLISSGNYHDFKELARAKSYDFTVYGRDNGSTYDPATGTVDPDGAGPAPSFVIDNPNFNFKSLRGNAVLRWEYLPGSTLFLVWTQDRNDFENVGEFNVRRSFNRLIDADADNIFLAKVSYHFDL